MALMALLLAVAVTLFSVMFTTKRSDLGFVSAGFWFLAGVQAYTLRTFPVESSLYYWMFWMCSFGLTIFCVICAMGMRREKVDVTDDTGKVTPDSEEAEMTPDTILGADSTEEKQPNVRRRASKRRSSFGGYNQ